MGAARIFSEQPFSADGGRSARGIRSDGEHAGLAQQSEAILIGERDAPEMAAVDVREFRNGAPIVH